MKSMMKAGAAPKANAPLKVGAPTKAAIQESAVTPSMPKAGVLKIGSRLKRPSIEPAQAPKGKQMRVDVAPSPASALIHRTIVRLQPPIESDDG
jgi:hypothetical protein